MIKTIDITYGLPASGKTRWSKLRTDESNYYYKSNKSFHLEMDNYMHYWSSDKNKYVLNSKEEFERIIKSNIINYFEHVIDRKNDDNYLILDGLFMTNESLIGIIEVIKSIKKFYSASLKIRVIRFNSNLETSLWNNKGRVDIFGNVKNGDVTIKRSLVEKINWELLKSTHRKSEIVDVSVTKKPLIKNFINDDGSDYQNDEFVSDTWNTGGNWRDCWGGGGDVEVELPAKIYELESILTRCNALHLYDYIIENIAIEEEKSESDYYGGCINYSYYTLSIDLVEEFLREEGMLRDILISDLIGNGD